MDMRDQVAKAIVSRLSRVTAAISASDPLTVSTYVLASRRIPAIFDGMRLVVLADLHARTFGEHQHELITPILSEKPSAVLVLGDWISDDFIGEEAQAVMDLARELSCRLPVYTILGNHEASAPHLSQMIHDLKGLGVCILADATVKIGCDGKVLPGTREGQEENAPSPEFILLSGLLTNYENGRVHSRAHEVAGPVLKQEYRQVMQGAARMSAGTLHLLMTHRPELFPLYQELGMEVVLAGHAHGGFAKLPDGRRLVAPDQGLLPTYTHGVYQKGRTTMIVSEGLGGPRLHICPQMICLELHAKTR